MILIAPTTLSTAQTITGTPVVGLHNMEYVAIEAIFVRAAGGTTADVYVQTSVDGGNTWIDIAEFSFATTTASKISSVVSTTALTGGTTPGDGALSANAILSGFLGDRLRAKCVVVGTYTGASSIAVYAVAKPFHR